MTRPFVAAFALSLLLLPCRPAHAEETAPHAANAGSSSEADALIRAGLDARKRGEDDKALGLFQQAVALYRTPRALAQVGLAEQALGHWEDAEVHLTEAIAATDDAWIKAHFAALHASLETVRSHLGTLELAVDVGDAELVIDGGLRGKITGPIRLAAGTYAIEIRHEGYYTVTRQVVITATQTARETVELRRIEAPPPPPPPPAVAAQAPPPEVPESTSRFGNTKWWLLGGGALLATGGAVALVLRQHQVSAYNEDSNCPGAAQPNDGKCAERLSAGQTLETLGLIGLIGGAALGAASGVLIVIDHPQPGSRRAGGNWGVACAGRF